MGSSEIVAYAPTRLDFVGGWTDVQPFCDEEAGLVVNAAFGLCTRVRVCAGQVGDALPSRFVRAARCRFGVEPLVESVSEAPIGSGLGGSGTFGVALVGALAAYAGRAMTRGEIADLAHEIEQKDLGITGGKQDQYAAAFGGFLALTFKGETVTVEMLALEQTLVSELQARSVVVYTGHSRVSGDVHARVQEAYRKGTPDTLHALQTIREVAHEFRKQLEAGSLDALGELLNANWEAQKDLHPATSNADIEELFRVATRAGALGGKALGAGGGGCLYFLAQPGAAAPLADALHQAGAEILPVQFDLSGLRVETVAGL